MLRKTRIFLLNPPFRERFSRTQRSPGVTKSGTFYYPIWLATATGFLEENGFAVHLVDAPAENLSREECYSQLKAFRPSLVVLDTSTASIMNDLEIAREIKLNVDCKVILVGTHVSTTAQETLEKEPQIDFIARKEYEETLLDLAEHLEMGKDVSTVEGISYRSGNEIIHNPERQFRKILDHLPFVSKTYKKYLNYKNYGYSITRYPMVTLMTSRGCPYQCHFCLYPQTFTGHKLRIRSPENVVEEIKYIKATFPDIQDLFIEDDTFTVDKNRVHAFCDQIIKERVKMAWTANARADLDYDLLKHMHEAGNRLLCVGFESVDSSVIERMEKRIRLEGLRQFVDNAERARVMIHGCFMYGNPGDTQNTFHQTLKFAKSLPLSSAQFFPIMAFPGTRLYNDLKKQGFLETEDYSQWVDEHGFHNSVVTYPHLKKEDIVTACNRAKISFHFRPRFMVHKLIETLHHPKEFVRNMRSCTTLVKNICRDLKRT